MIDLRQVLFRGLIINLIDSNPRLRAVHITSHSEVHADSLISAKPLDEVAVELAYYITSGDAITLPDSHADHPNIRDYRVEYETAVQHPQSVKISCKILDDEYFTETFINFLKSFGVKVGTAKPPPSEPS